MTRFSLKTKIISKTQNILLQKSFENDEFSFEKPRPLKPLNEHPLSHKKWKIETNLELLLPILMNISSNFLEHPPCFSQVCNLIKNNNTPQLQ
jgi:hypothetical protein